MPRGSPWFAAVCLLSCLNAVRGDQPVKKQSTLRTPEEAAAARQDAGLRNLALNGDSRPFTAAVGNAPAAQWVDKPDDWFWQVMPTTTIQRCTTVGNDNFASPKAGCPVHGQAIYAVDAYYPWLVDVETLPYKLKCPVGGEIYPSSDFAAGDMTTGPYADDGTGCVIGDKTYHFLGLYSHYAYNTMLQPAIKSFGHAYLTTGDKRYAHKAAVCLLKEAFEYPNATDRKARTYLPGYGEESGMITDVVWSGGALVASATCYDEICGALEGDDELVAFARQHLPEIRTVDDVRVYIEDRLFRPGIQAIIDKRVLPNTGWAEEAMATLALMLNDFGPKRPNSQDCLDWLYYGGGRLITLGNQFYKDGSSYESTGYNDARSGFVRCAATLQRLRALAPQAMDPQRYPDVSQNEKLQAFHGVYKPAVTMLGGQWTIAVGDAGGVDIARTPQVGRNERASEFLDGYGLGILRSGTGSNQRGATLFYGGVRGHAHYDPLMLGLFGFGRDLLPNIGYPQSWNYASAWEWSLLTHNTVVVDRDEQPCSTVIGSLTVWAPGPDLQVMEASKRPYRREEPRGERGPEVTDYRRLTALVDAGPEQWYAVDIFRVTGGSDHLQSWHGGYTPQPVAIGGATLTPQERGTLAGEAVEYGQRYQDRWDPYCYLHDVARGPMQPLTSVDFDYATDDKLHVRLNFVPVEATELITARGGAPIAPDKDVLQWALPHRTANGGGLQSQFVTVIEAYAGQRFLGEIQRLPVSTVGEAAYRPIALAITVPGGRDIILANGREQDTLSCGDMTLTGKFGLVRERGGKVTGLHLVAGSKLTCGNLQVSQTPLPGPARIVGVDRERRTVTLHGPLPPLDTLRGRRLAIDNHGERLTSYTVLSAERAADGKARLTLDSSGNIGEGFATGFHDGVVKNGPEVNMPFAGLVKIGDRFDYSDCFYYGGHLENGQAGVDYKVRGVMGFPYQAWGNLHLAGLNDVYLCDQVPAQQLRAALGENGRWTIYEYGLGDEVHFDSQASLNVE
jgi:oligo-alginate lyase